MKDLVHKIRSYSLTLLLVTASVPFWLPTNVNGANMTVRRITVGTSRPSTVTSHTFQFNTITAGNIGSIEFEYCSNTPFVGTACTAPAGLNTLAAILATQSGITGFSVHANTTSNRIVITRASAVAAPQAANFRFNNITNPSTPSTSTFVRVATFASTDGTGARTDDGAVAFSTSGGLGGVGFVPPYLTFCAAVTVALNCSTSSGFNIDLGILASNVTRTATTEFSTATNDPTGYNVYTLGTTLTSGNNVITAMNPASGSALGASQFGMNVMANNNPAVGQNPSGVGTGVSLAGYNTPNVFRFLNGAAIVASPKSTDFNKFTVSYIVNVPDTQPSGRYSTTITYLAVAAF